jgi:hypothetical protein
MDDKKCCLKCSELKSLDAFHADENTEDKHRAWCKTCRAQDRFDKKMRATQNKQIQKLDNEGFKTLDKLARSGGSLAPHKSEALEHIMVAFGGAAGFGRWLFANFITAPPGSAIRERMLSRILDLIERVSETDHSNKPVEEMDDEEIRSHLESAVRVLAGRKAGKSPRQPKVKQSETARLAIDGSANVLEIPTTTLEKITKQVKNT